MRWQKGDKYIEIEDGVSVDHGPVSNVVSNAFEGHLPAPWRTAVPRSDTEAYKRLVESVRDWAAREGYR